jgi:hypothetical protein
MSDFIQRLVAEKSELDEKKSKLETFKESDNFKKVELVQQSLLNIQLRAMMTYSECLAERLRFLNSN